LHVGAGTFKPVSNRFIGNHFMHREQIIIKPELLENLLINESKRVIAVGTTAARTLESLFVMGAKLKLGHNNPFQIEQWEIYDNPEIAEISTKESLTTLLNHIKDNSLNYLSGSTSLIIVPGYRHKIMKGIITNFHQPKSTLLLLISSFVGNNWKEIYSHALNNGYRFLSYGDSNLYL
jgi:S-adenosylmethionine:tRNA ribosyltransferase-isomerase